MADIVELEPESKAYVDMSNEAGLIDLTLPVEKIRELVANVCEKLKGDFEFTGSREDREVSSVDSNGVNYDIPVTIFKGQQESESTWNNIMVYFHGGGWTWGSRKSHNTFCEMLASECKCVVVNVEYRLSPEHKYPAAYEDAKAVVEWCQSNKIELANNDSAIVGVAGDSAGGSLSASTCHLLKNLDYQVLIYPTLTMARKNRDPYPSEEKYSDGYILTNEQMDWFINTNLLNNEEEEKDPRGSPLIEKSFVGQPPALIIEAECDPLADQSPDYHAKLEEAGVHSEHVIFKQTIHGFVARPGHFKETVNRAVKVIADFLAKL